MQDSMLSDMNHIWFVKVITPKVQGTINIVSTLCPTRSYLDSFIMCSSSAGVIANRGQAKYAATNTFLHAFACQLMTGGYPATSISLGSVFSVGWIVENQLRLSIALTYRALWKDLLFSILEYRINPAWGAAEYPDLPHGGRDTTRAGLSTPVHPSARVHRPFVILSALGHCRQVPINRTRGRGDGRRCDASHRR
ncbi:uncharacterized protein AKAW2_60012S [Aspergillus luchuensis]|uniref:Ketoreductase (KR) domain-containing protein n=1 Tax=Aspergillus kawachii TaxID=1069201 RepID=A0A7R8A2F3_ASPKA|nr:uncharacterized protein AKAW2_60012S [Aspergillus luchuensis]BCS01748.1 hypothetical protein AKAW2_60012S [Aspergillus luchuensis]